MASISHSDHRHHVSLSQHRLPQQQGQPTDMKRRQIANKGEVVMRTITAGSLLAWSLPVRSRTPSTGLGNSGPDPNEACGCASVTLRCMCDMHTLGSVWVTM